MGKTKKNEEDETSKKLKKCISSLVQTSELILDEKLLKEVKILCKYVPRTAELREPESHEDFQEIQTWQMNFLFKQIEGKIYAKQRKNATI